MDAEIQHAATSTLPLHTSSAPNTPDLSPSEITQDLPFELLTLPAGLTLSYSHHGAPLSSSPFPPIFYFHGTPGTRIEAAFLSPYAQALGLHVIGLDRPGHGRSSPQPGRTLLDYPADVLALADHLGIERFGIIALSGGCASLMACLHLIPRSRLVAATIISGGWSAAKFGTKGMMFQNRVLHWMVQYSTWVVAALVDFMLGAACRDPTRAKLYEMMNTQKVDAIKPEADRKAVEAARAKPEHVRLMVENVREALMNGCEASAWDLWLEAGKWPFELGEVDVGEGRVTMWHGTEDMNVPIGVADQAAEEMKGVVYKRLEGDGHISIAFTRQEEVLTELLGRLG